MENKKIVGVVAISVVLSGFFVFNALTAWNWLGSYITKVQFTAQQDGAVAMITPAIQSLGQQVSIPVDLTEINGEKYTVVMLAQKIETTTSTPETTK